MQIFPQQTTSQRRRHETFHQNRVCRHCGTPIADQVHAARQFCDRQVLPDGSIKNCKDDYWAAAKKETDAPYQALVRYHKKVEEILTSYFTKGNRYPTMADLNSIDVDLTRCLHRVLNKDETISHFFIGFEIIVDLNTYQTKLKSHGKEIL